MQQLTNIRSVSVPSIGKLPLAENPGTFSPSGERRTHKPGRQASDGGYTSAARAARLELNLNTLGLDLTVLNAVQDEDVTVRLSDGQVHLMSMAFVEEPAPYGGDGDARVTIVANESERIA